MMNLTRITFFATTIVMVTRTGLLLSWLCADHVVHLKVCYLVLSILVIPSFGSILLRQGGVFMVSFCNGIQIAVVEQVQARIGGWCAAVR